MILGESFALLAALAWATVGIVMAFLVRSLNSFAIVAARLLLGILFLSPALLVKGLEGGISLPPAGTLTLLVASGVVSLGIGDSLYVMSLPLIGVSRAHPISITLCPLFTFILAATLLGENITSATIAGSCLVIGGVLLVVLSGRALRQTSEAVEQGPRGLIMVMTAAALWAVGFALLKLGVTGVDPVVGGYIRLLAGGVFLIGILLWRRPRLNLRQLTGWQRRGLVWIGLMTALSPGFLVVTAVKYAGAAKVSVLTSTSPLFALPLAVLFLGERLTWRTVLGTVLAIAGTCLVVL
ncbi:MAG: DMT family transporter [Chloroflexota bacterium]|nr:DMT family transporter [Chloroflexota bacterium]